MQVMGHKDPKIFSRHYISKTTFADVQSLVQGETQRTDLLKQIQRMSNLRDERAPGELSPEEKAKLDEHVELKVCREEVAAAKSKIMEEYGSLRAAPSDIHRGYESLQTTVGGLCKKLECERLHGVRKEWFADMLATPEGLQPENEFSDADSFNEYNVLTVINYVHIIFSSITTCTYFWRLVTKTF